MPADNRAYWTMKIARNQQRDAENQATLTALGWRWRVIWECEIKTATTRLLEDMNSERSTALPRTSARDAALSGP
jgi:G:T-mismatch repair DNA endonuclease (very short patch repair protein)